MSFSAACLCLILLSACGAPPPPEGPAERLGKAIDNLTTGVRDFGESWDTRTEEERKRDEWSERRREHRRRDDYRSSRPEGWKYPDDDSAPSAESYRGNDRPRNEWSD